MSTLTLRDVTIEYSSGGYLVRPINGLDLDVADGELVLLLGASGCGKTTLLCALAALLTPTRGSIRLNETEVTKLRGRALAEYRRRTIGVVYQSFNLIPSLSALDNVAVASWNVGASGRAGRDRARAILETLGLKDRLRHRPSDLSGGEQQRVAIARALSLDPQLLLADEPTAHLDELQVEGILRLLRESARPGRMVIVATHDDRLLPLADRVIELTPRRHPVQTEPIRIELPAGSSLFAQGDDGDVAYVVEKGEIELIRELADGREELVQRVGAGRYFGELAPLFRLRRTAAARAAVDSVVTTFTPGDLRSLMASKATPSDARNHASVAGHVGAQRDGGDVEAVVDDHR
ncbi:MAG TPA: ATP-binding cassette domain-containing protein [Acidimicrobiia bacterium]|nr:ATP-binding cassette domain-containing protein [Acidimicrobiia bacterium]